MKTKAQIEIHIGRIIVYSVLLLFAIIIFFSSFYVVSAGHRAILLTFGNPDMTPKQEGLHFKFPFIQSVAIMDIRTQKYEVTKASASSRDLQIVTTDITLNYFISPESTPEIYKTIGVDYQNKIIVPAVQEVMKSSTAEYTAEELITKRPEVKDKIDTRLKDRLQEWNILVQSVAITNFDFSEEFNKAIELKVTAEQNALASKNKLEQVKYEAEQTIAKAQADAEALRLKKQEITPELVQLSQIEFLTKSLEINSKAIDKWNGVLPSVTGGAIPFLDVSKFFNSS